MKDILGIKRITNLVVLVLVCAGMAAALYLYLMPSNQDLDRKNRVLQSQVSSKRNEATDMTNDFVMLNDQKGSFQAMKDAGFFSDQSRMLARQKIVDIQEYTDVLSVAYAISPLHAVETEDSRNADYAVVQSKITINLDAVDDKEIYKFAWWVENTLPGHVALVTANIVRELDVDDNVLKKIGQDGPLTMVKGQLEFLWQTMMPRSQLIDAGVLKPEGAF